MADLIYDEAKLFAICLVLGVFLAMVYDGLRILRVLFSHWDVLVDVEDLLYWIFTAWMVFRTLFYYNQGMLRGYAFFGMLAGVILYSLTISSLLMRLVQKVYPAWEKGRARISGPIMKIVKKFRKALKNTVTEVKIAVKGR